jgi:hypothetical protein
MDEQTVDQLTDQEFLKNRYVFQVNDLTLDGAMLRRIQPGRLMPAPESPRITWMDRTVQEPPAPAERATAWILVWQVPSAYAAEGIQDGAPALLQWSPKHHEWMYLGIWLNHFRYWQPISAPSGGPHG